MSSNKLSTNRFDKYIPLFGRKNDNRVRLFLHALQRNALENMKKAGRSIIELKDVRFVNNTVPFHDEKRDKINIKDIVLNVDEKNVLIPKTTTEKQIYNVNNPKNIFYNPSTLESNSNSVTIQPKNNIINANIVGGAQEPEWLYAISQSPMEIKPFINNSHWDNAKDTLSLTYDNQHKHDDNYIHSEWVKFFGQFMLRIGDTDNNTPINVTNNILEIIKDLSGNKSPNSIEYFMQFIVQLLFSNFNSNKLYDILSWNDITSFKYNNINKIFYNFHLYNFIVKKNIKGEVTWFEDDESKFLTINNCLNAALGIPLYNLSGLSQNKPYDLLLSDKLYMLPQYNTVPSSDIVCTENNLNKLINYFRNYVKIFLYLIIQDLYELKCRNPTLNKNQI